MSGTTRHQHPLFYVAVCQIRCDEEEDQVRAVSSTDSGSGHGRRIDILASYYHRKNLIQGLSPYSELNDDAAVIDDNADQDQWSQHVYGNQGESFRIDASHFAKYAKYKLQVLARNRRHVSPGSK